MIKWIIILAVGCVALYLMITAKDHENDDK